MKTEFDAGLRVRSTAAGSTFRYAFCSANSTMTQRAAQSGIGEIDALAAFCAGH